MGVPGYAHGPFSRKFLMGFYSVGPCKCNMKPNMKSVALPFDEIIAIEVWGGGDTQSWGREGRRQSGMVPFERGFITSYRHFIVTFPLSLPVSEILPFLCASAPIFPHPTSSLPKICPCSPGSRWMAFGVQRAKLVG